MLEHYWRCQKLANFEINNWQCLFLVDNTVQFLEIGSSLVEALVVYLLDSFGQEQ